MATLNVINSTNYAVYSDGTKIAKSTDASISLNHEPRDITNKDSAGWRELLEGLRSGSASAGGFYAYDAAFGLDDLFAIWTGRTTTVIKASTGVTADQLITGTAYVTNLEISSPGAEDNVSWTANFEFTGAVTTSAEA